MSRIIRWILATTQRNPLHGIIVMLLFAIVIVGGVTALIYNDKKKENTDCTVEVAALRKEVEELHKENLAIATDYYTRRKSDDSLGMAKLNDMNIKLQDKIRQQEEVNKTQTSNIVLRNKAIQINKTTKKRNDEQIKALQNDIKK